MDFYRISDPRRLEAGDPSLLVYEEAGRGRRTVVGATGGLVGLAMTAGVVLILILGPAWDLGLLPLLGGSSILCLWSVRLLIHSRLTLDRRAGTVSRSWGPSLGLGRKTDGLDAFTAVTTSYLIPYWAGYRTRVEPVALTGDGGQALVLFQAVPPARAQALAREIAGFLGLRLELARGED